MKHRNQRRHFFVQPLHMVAIGTLWFFAACTLAFDTEGVTFEEATQEPEPSQEEPEPEPSMPSTELGKLCGIDVLSSPPCLPESSDWPNCAHAQCQTFHDDGFCTQNPSSLFGHCSIPCETNDDCQQDSTDPFVSSMQCVSLRTEDETSVCLPGSQERCSLEKLCPDDEICRTVYEDPRFRPFFEADNKQVCQTPHPQSTTAGMFCVEDPRDSAELTATVCDSGLCYAGRCLSLCRNDEECGDPSLQCISGTEESENPLGLCLPQVCFDPSSCEAMDENETYCSLLQFNNDTVVPICVTENPLRENVSPLGGTCFDNVRRDYRDDLCATNFCLDIGIEGMCSALCLSDQECAPNQRCIIEDFVDPNNARFFTGVCSYASGSLDPCGEGQGPCGEGESCAPFLRGQLTATLQQIEEAVVEGQCVKTLDGAPLIGTECSNSQRCSSPNGCVAYQGQSYCTELCQNDEDCPGNFVCQQINYYDEDAFTDGVAPTSKFCVPNL